MGLSYFEIVAENNRWHYTPPSKERQQVVTRGNQTALSSAVSNAPPTSAEELDLSGLVRSISLESIRALYLRRRKTTLSTGGFRWTPWGGGPPSWAVWWSHRQVVCCLKSKDERLPGAAQQQCEVPVDVSCICRVWGGKALSVSCESNGPCGGSWS